MCFSSSNIFHASVFDRLVFLLFFSIFSLSKGKELETLYTLKNWGYIGLYKLASKYFNVLMLKSSTLLHYQYLLHASYLLEQDSRLLDELAVLVDPRTIPKNQPFPNEQKNVYLRALNASTFVLRCSWENMVTK